MLELLIGVPYSKILYESPHRLLTLLEELNRINQGVDVAVCRELTKKFEEVLRGTPSELMEHFQKQTPRGEFVIIL